MGAARHRDFLRPAPPPTSNGTRPHSPAPGHRNLPALHPTGIQPHHPTLANRIRPFPAKDPLWVVRNPCWGICLRLPVHRGPHGFGGPPRVRSPHSQYTFAKSALSGGNALVIPSSEPTAFWNIGPGTTCDLADVFLRSGFSATTQNVLPLRVPLPQGFPLCHRWPWGGLRLHAGCRIPSTTPP